METLIIAFGHKARRGKDTAVRAILDARGGQYDIRQYSFAQALKREVNTAAQAQGSMLGLFMYLNKLTKKDGSPVLPSWVKYESDPDMTDPLCPLGKQRTLLQWWGTEYRRAEDPYYWIKALDRTIRLEGPQIGVISDLRFLNEASWVKKDPATPNKIIQVERNGFIDSPLITGAAINHQSECELDGVKYWDYQFIVDDGDVQGLKDTAVFIFDEIVNALKPPTDLDQFPEDQLTEYAIDESKQEQETEARPA